jgi:hypothetical protein
VPRQSAVNVTKKRENKYIVHIISGLVEGKIRSLP